MPAVFIPRCVCPIFNSTILVLAIENLLLIKSLLNCTVTQTHLGISQEVSAEEKRQYFFSLSCPFFSQEKLLLGFVEKLCIDWRPLLWSLERGQRISVRPRSGRQWYVGRFKIGNRWYESTQDQILDRKLARQMPWWEWLGGGGEEWVQRKCKARPSKGRGHTFQGLRSLHIPKGQGSFLQNI